MDENLPPNRFELRTAGEKPRIYTSAKQAGAAFHAADVDKFPNVRRFAGGEPEMVLARTVPRFTVEASAPDQIPKRKEVDPVPPEGEEFRSAYYNAVEASLRMRLDSVEDWSKVQPKSSSGVWKLDRPTYDDLETLAFARPERAIQAWVDQVGTRYDAPTLLDSDSGQVVTLADTADLKAARKLNEYRFGSSVSPEHAPKQSQQPPPQSVAIKEAGNSDRSQGERVGEQLGTSSIDVAQAAHAAPQPQGQAMLNQQAAAAVESVKQANVQQGPAVENSIESADPRRLTINGAEVHRLTFMKNRDGGEVSTDLRAYSLDGKPVFDKSRLNNEELVRTVGQEVASAIAGQKGRAGTLQGDALMVQPHPEQDQRQDVPQTAQQLRPPLVAQEPAQLPRDGFTEWASQQSVADGGTGIVPPGKATPVLDLPDDWRQWANQEAQQQAQPAPAQQPAATQQAQATPAQQPATAQQAQAAPAQQPATAQQDPAAPAQQPADVPLQYAGQKIDALIVSLDRDATPQNPRYQVSADAGNRMLLQYFDLTAKELEGLVGARNAAEVIETVKQAPAGWNLHGENLHPMTAQELQDQPRHDAGIRDRLLAEIDQTKSPSYLSINAEQVGRLTFAPAKDGRGHDVTAWDVKGRVIESYEKLSLEGMTQLVGRENAKTIAATTAPGELKSQQFGKYNLAELAVQTSARTYYFSGQQAAYQVQAPEQSQQNSQQANTATQSRLNQTGTPAQSQDDAQQSRQAATPTRQAQDTFDTQQAMEARRAAIMAELENRYIVNEVAADRTKYHFKGEPSQVAFEDLGKRVATARIEPDVARSMIDLAQAKGWASIHVKGEDAFRRAAWLEASSRGMTATGYAPTPADLRRLDAMRSERQGNQVEAGEQKPAQDGHQRAANQQQAQAPAQQRQQAAAAAAAAAQQPQPSSREQVLKVFEATLLKLKPNIDPSVKDRMLKECGAQWDARAARGEGLPVIKVYDHAAPPQHAPQVAVPTPQQGHGQAMPARGH